MVVRFLAWRAWHLPATHFRQCLYRPRALKRPHDELPIVVQAVSSLSAVSLTPDALYLVSTCRCVSVTPILASLFSRPQNWRSCLGNGRHSYEPMRRGSRWNVGLVNAVSCCRAPHKGKPGRHFSFHYSRTRRPVNRLYCVSSRTSHLLCTSWRSVRLYLQADGDRSSKDSLAALATETGRKTAPSCVYRQSSLTWPDRSRLRISRNGKGDKKLRGSGCDSIVGEWCTVTGPHFIPYMS
jgi:hypothetical protein